MARTYRGSVKLMPFVTSKIIVGDGEGELDGGTDVAISEGGHEAKLFPTGTEVEIV
jgi:hypothetical protein